MSFWYLGNLLSCLRIKLSSEKIWLYKSLKETVLFANFSIQLSPCSFLKLDTASINLYLSRPFSNCKESKNFSILHFISNFLLEKYLKSPECHLILLILLHSVLCSYFAKVSETLVLL